MDLYYSPPLILLPLLRCLFLLPGILLLPFSFFLAPPLLPLHPFSSFSLSSFLIAFFISPSRFPSSHPPSLLLFHFPPSQFLFSSYLLLSLILSFSFSFPFSFSLSFNPSPSPLPSRSLKITRP